MTLHEPCVSAEMFLGSSLLQVCSQSHNLKIRFLSNNKVRRFGAVIRIMKT